MWLDVSLVRPKQVPPARLRLAPNFSGRAVCFWFDAFGVECVFCGFSKREAIGAQETYWRGLWRLSNVNTANLGTQLNFEQILMF